MTGRRLVKAACQPAETYQRTETERRCRSVYSLLDYCTIVAVSATDGRSIDTLAIYHTNRLGLSRYRYLQDGAVWHVQPITLDMDPMRGHCNGTRYVERRATDQSSVYRGRASRVAGRLSVLFILPIPLSPTSLLTDVRGGVAMRKSEKNIRFFVITVNVVYKDVLL